MEKGTRAGGGKGGKMLHLAWKNRRKTCSWRDGGDAKGNSAHSREDPSLVKCGNIGSRLLSPVHARNPIVNPILRNSIETAARSSSIEVAWLSIKKRERERRAAVGKWSAVIDCLSDEWWWWFIFFDFVRGMEKINYGRNVKYFSLLFDKLIERVVFKRYEISYILRNLWILLDQDRNLGNNDETVTSFEKYKKIRWDGYWTNNIILFLHNINYYEYFGTTFISK